MTRCLPPRAFTLIELLAVVAVIGILAALLIPAVGGMMESGHRTACLANLRQLAAAAQLASADQDGRYPSLQNYTFDAAGHIEELSEYKVAGSPEPQDWGIALAPYLNLEAVDTVWVPPADIPKVMRSPLAAANPRIRRDYPWVFECANYRYNSYAAERRAANAVNPARAMLFMNAAWPAWPDDAFPARSNPGLNAAFLDGHVRFLPLKEYRALSPGTDYQNPLFLNGWFQ